MRERKIAMQRNPLGYWASYWGIKDKLDPAGAFERRESYSVARLAHVKSRVTILFSAEPQLLGPSVGTFRLKRLLLGIPARRCAPAPTIALALREIVEVECTRQTQVAQ
jgi:hypothetical protein